MLFNCLQNSWPRELWILSCEIDSFLCIYLENSVQNQLSVIAAAIGFRFWKTTSQRFTRSLFMSFSERASPFGACCSRWAWIAFAADDITTLDANAISGLFRMYFGALRDRNCGRWLNNAWRNRYSQRSRHVLNRLVCLIRAFSY